MFLMEEIKSREIAEMFVMVLLKGVKSRIAVKNDKDEWELVESSLINQYLNPYNDRKRMTRKIADALSNTFKYYLYNSGKKYAEIYAEAILFIYSASYVDLTYFHNNMKENQETLIKIIDSLFHAFAGKESIKINELENLVYTMTFGQYWNIENNMKVINIASYYEYADASYHCCTKKDIIELNKIFESGKAYEKIQSCLQFLKDLIYTDNIESLSEKYEKFYSRLTGKPINGSGWKKSVLLNTFYLSDLTESIKLVLIELSRTNNYLIINAYFSLLLEDLNNSVNETAGKSENYELFNNDTFQRVQQNLKDCINIMQLQIRVNKEIGTFGSCHCMMNSVKADNIKDVRQFIAVIIDFLFYGVSTKKGRDIGNEETKEVWSDIIYKYINGEQKKFSVKVKEALYYRIKHHLKNTEYFSKLLWQMFYYVFGVDLYMLNNFNSKEKWCDLFNEIFDIILQGGSMNELEVFVKWKYNCLWFENETESFTPDEIEFFRKYNSIGFKKYIYIFDNLINTDRGFDVLNLKSEMTLKYIQLKINPLLEKLKNTVQFIESLLKSRTAEEFLNQYENYSVLISENQINWKYKIYCDLLDRNGERITIDIYQLEELIKYISVGINLNRLSESKYDFKRIRENIQRYIKIFLEMPNKKYRYYYDSGYNRKEEQKEESFNQTNIQFIKGSEIENLYTVLNMIYKYFIYSEWTDRNMKIIEKNKVF